MRTLHAIIKRITQSIKVMNVEREIKIFFTELSFLHLLILPRMPDVTDNSPSDGGLIVRK